MVENILLIEDDKLLNKGISFALKREYNVFSAFTFDEAEKYLNNENLDLIILDITLPDGDGICFCREIRKRSEVPIIFLTAKDTPKDMVDGFECGCDDYIAKPFDLQVLKKRVQAVLRRANGSMQNQFKQKNLMINFDKMSITKDGKVVNITVTEYKLLECLVKNKGQIMTREILLQKLWDDDGNFVDENTLNVNIRRLRKKIEDNPKEPSFIVTVFGIGYTWGESL